MYFATYKVTIEVRKMLFCFIFIACCGETRSAWEEEPSFTTDVPFFQKSGKLQFTTERTGSSRKKLSNILVTDESTDVLFGESQVF